MDYESKPRIERLRIEDVHPNSYNPNKMDPDAYAALRLNIQEFGYRDLILVRPDETQGGYEIMDGEHRWKVLKELGFEEAEFMVQVLATDRAKISTVAMNNVHGAHDPIGMGVIVADLMKEGYGADELSSLMGYTKKQLEGFQDLTMPPPDEEIEAGEATEEGLPPVELSILLMESVKATFEEAVELALEIMVSRDMVPMVGGQVGVWVEAMKKGHRLSRSKARSRALELILRTFMGAEKHQIEAAMADMTEEG